MSRDTTLEFNYRDKRFRNAEAGLEFFAKELQKSFKKDGTKALRGELRFYLRAVSKALESRHAGAWPGGTTSNTLSKRSGRTLISIKRSVRVNRATIARNVKGTIGGAHYLKVQEFGTIGAGGTLPSIVPVRARHLTIPLPPALDSRGVPLKKSARDWDNTFSYISSKGNKLIATKVAGELVNLYVLKKRVDIPPRLGMKKTLDAGTDFFIDKAVLAMRNAILKGMRA